MQAMQVVKACADISGKSLYRISLDMGQSARYVASACNKQTTPKADTLARMLDQCGYALCAVPLDSVPRDAIVIE